ncbi:MAG: cytochrome c oxidase subunit II [Flavobacteriales bacterium]|nr:cytochrome c oxidase subunit II [Flavobacteriales bacterium]
MVNLLIAIVIILAILVVAKLVRVFELSTELKGVNPAEITPQDNKTQATLFLIMGLAWLAFVVYGTIVYGKEILPPSASVHGEEIDGLMNLTWWIISPMFFLTHLLMIFFGYKYYYRKERTATFFAHSTKLEMIWTVIPTIVLSSLIIYGLTVWHDVTGAEPDDAIEIELYAKQFDWAARYAGEDNVLGKSGYRLIESNNPLGVSMEDPASADDKIVRGELHLPVGKPVVFKFHSRDVLHSAYMPHFRLQMNCVPGMTTQFHMVPKTTSAEMKESLGNPDFEYLLLCNKICGAAHYNMQMNIIVESEEDYNAWLAGKKTMAETMTKKEPVAITEVVEEEAGAEETEEDNPSEEESHTEEEPTHG